MKTHYKIHFMIVFKYFHKFIIRLLKTNLPMNAILVKEKFNLKT